MSKFWTCDCDRSSSSVNVYALLDGAALTVTAAVDPGAAGLSAGTVLGAQAASEIATRMASAWRTGTFPPPPRGPRRYTPSRAIPGSWRAPCGQWAILTGTRVRTCKSDIAAALRRAERRTRQR